MRMARRTAVVMSGVLAVSAVVAFFSEPRVVDAEARGVPAPNPKAMEPFLVGEPIWPGEPIHASRVWPLQAGATPYLVLDNRAEDGLSEMVLTTPGNQHNVWRFERLGQRVERLRRGRDGNIYITGMENLEHDVIIKLDQPICVLPRQFEPGQTIRTESKMTIVSRDDPSHVRDTGTITMALTYDADQTLRTPAGDFDCHRVRIDCDASFTVGSTRSTSTYYYADGVGLVAENYDARTTILLFSSQRHIRVVMATDPDKHVSR